METILLAVIALLLVLIVALGWLALRWVRVLRAGGVNVALRWRGSGQIGDNGVGWHLGIGRYRGADFAWYRIMSLRLGPDRVLSRDELEIAERREPGGAEAYALPGGATVLRFTEGDTSAIEVAMGPGALTGFLSWLESSPPGRRMRG